MRYLTGLIVLPERKNVSMISRSFLDYKDQSSVNNFITDSTWSDKEFHDMAIQVVKDEVRKQKIKHGKLVIDDTLSEKSGKHIEGVGWFRDISQGKNILAHNIVSTHYFAGTFHVPLDFEIYVKEKDCQDKNKFRTKLELAKELLKKATSYDLPISVLIFDSWYADEGLISLAKSLGIEAYVTEEVNESHPLRRQQDKDKFEKTIPRDRFRPVEIYTSLAGEKKTYFAYSTTVRMNHLDGVKVKLVISFKDNDLGGEPSFYISNVLVWEAKKILQTYAFRWSIEGFHRDAKQSLGLEDYQMRKIRGVKRHVSMVFFAYILLQLGSGFDTIVHNLKRNLRTIGSRCRMAGTEILSSLARFVLKMAHKDMDARKIIDLLTQPLENSGYYG
ncbi:MAG: IS701 family transposase [Nitrososphaerota archaeon]|nr:IS701 family transposase [Nitrososphaerota archaeon]MDG6922690.1 IS701 family transposase [Nitrososphaerota archaeon]